MERKSLILTVVAALGMMPACSNSDAADLSNKDLVKMALSSLFIDRDPQAIDRYWDPDTFIQHNPQAANGPPRQLLTILSQSPAFKYEMGMVIADGDRVMVHSRYTGLGPKPVIVTDIFRVKDKRLVEHWDVIQDEVPASETVSGNPMFSVDE